MFAPCINSIKNTFIVPTDARYYKIIELLKQFKITILAPTCFGSRRNHNQGAVLCLAKTTKLFFCARRTSTEKPFRSFIIVCIRWNNKSVFDIILCLLNCITEISQVIEGRTLANPGLSMALW